MANTKSFDTLIDEISRMGVAGNLSNIDDTKPFASRESLTTKLPSELPPTRRAPPEPDEYEEELEEVEYETEGEYEEEGVEYEEVVEEYEEEPPPPPRKKVVRRPVQTRPAPRPAPRKVARPAPRPAPPRQQVEPLNLTAGGDAELSLCNEMLMHVEAIKRSLMRYRASRSKGPNNG